jgi:regulator of sigma E protease
LDQHDPNQRHDGLKHEAESEVPQEFLGSSGPAAVEPETLGQWLRLNGPMLAFMVVIAGLVCYFLEVAVFIKVAVGLGLIVFIHELGHFLVAKWCDVHVTTFSIGFGPALPFCSWVWGETTYKIAAFPLGGFVQMVGQVDGDEASDGSEEDPRSYRNKSVWQRMAIISAGVTMNAIFACIAFTVIYLGPGKARQVGVIAVVETNKPAFKLGLRTGSDILEVNNIQNPYFDDLKYEVVASLDKIHLVTQRRHGIDPLGLDVDPAPVAVDVLPHQGSLRTIGISPALRLQIAAQKYSRYKMAAYPGSAAAQATPAFKHEDRIVGMTNPEHPGDPAKMALPDDPRNPGSGYKDIFEFQRRMTALAGKEIVIQIERGGSKEIINITVPPAFAKTIGAHMKMGPITAVRESSAAARDGGVVARSTTDAGADGDVIEAVEVKDADGTVLRWEKGKNLDPERLPFELKQWAARLWKATNNDPKPEDLLVKLSVKRLNKQNGGQIYSTVTVSLPWDISWRNDRILPMDFASPVAIPELGFAYLIKNEVDTITDPSCGLEKDDQIVDVMLTALTEDNKTQDGRWETKSIKGAEWAYLSHVLQTVPLGGMKVKVKRGNETKEIELVLRTDTSWPQDERGLLMLEPDTRIEKASGVVEAISLGLRDTHRHMVQIYLQLRGFAVRTIALENLGGPLTIANAAYRVAQLDFWEFVSFLAFISVNLAVLNFLPVPVLDGGHMVFLIYEKLFGKPASEGVRVGATYAGLLILGCLMIFVFWLDIRRLITG